MGILLIFTSIWILIQKLQAGKLDTISTVISQAFLLIGLGLLRFTYVIITKKESKLSSGVIYLSSITFMAIGLAAAFYALAVRQDSYQAYLTAKGAGVFIIGLMGFIFVRRRDKLKQP